MEQTAQTQDSRQFALAEQDLPETKIFAFGFVNRINSVDSPTIGSRQTMRATINRPINDDEVRVIRTALLGCAVIPEAPGLVVSLGNLRVVGGCECGCASVHFVITTNEQQQPIAEGLGIISIGKCVGVIVWGNAYEVTGLEVYDLSAVATGLVLSELQSVVPWEEGNAVLYG